MPSVFAAVAVGLADLLQSGAATQGGTSADGGAADMGVRVGFLLLCIGGSAALIAFGRLAWLTAVSKSGLTVAADLEKGEKEQLLESGVVRSHAPTVDDFASMTASLTKSGLRPGTSKDEGGPKSGAQASSDSFTRPQMLRQKTERHVRAELQAKSKELSWTANRATAEIGRLQRMNTFNKSLKDMWDKQWQHIHLGELPHDVEDADDSGHHGIQEREPELNRGLQDLFSTAFANLFDVYLYYAKVDIPDSVDASAAELYRMTDSKWKMMLKDAGVIDDKSSKKNAGTATSISTMTASNIFKSVNQRRDLLEKGGVRGTKGRGHETTDKAAHAAMADAATIGFGVEAGAGRHLASAGSLYGFTFSEFMEGLVFVALELPPATAVLPTSGLTTPYVVSCVRALLEEHVLLKAKSSGIFETRRVLLDSVDLSAALDAIRGDLEPIYSWSASQPQRVGSLGRPKGESTGFALGHFLELTDGAKLIGGQLSRVQVKTIFVSSLELTAESAGNRRPLLTRAEFDEALLRLCLIFEPSKEELMAAAGTPGPRTLASLFDQDGDARARDFAQTVAGKVASKPSSSEDMVGTILERLPLVCGRLLAIFEQQYAGARQRANMKKETPQSTPRRDATPRRDGVKQSV